MTEATRAALEELFAGGEEFYWCVLILSDQGHAPFLSAWSHQAHQRFAETSPEDAPLVRWSYADSPYCDWGSEHFTPLRELFGSLFDVDGTAWPAEMELRTRATIQALRDLDAEGIFARSQDRCDILVNAEVVPPDASNTTRARALNHPENRQLARWLDEAAEPDG